jgi:predicted NUDIX family NTP pyrophosphohydrolase
MIRRKDSLAYIEFLRGKYDIDNVNYLQKLLNGCSRTERDQIRVSTFDELWGKLWFSTNTNKKQTERMMKEYHQSRVSFDILQTTTLPSLLDACTVYYETPEWEFPKGRRSSQETNMKCAIREFEEETDVSSDDYTLLDNMVPMSEEYIGSNGVKYKHIYYMAFYTGSSELSINDTKYEQFSEIGDIGWFTLDECSQKIRKEQSTKHQILCQVEEFIGRWKHDFNVKE